MHNHIPPETPEPPPIEPPLIAPLPIEPPPVERSTLAAAPVEPPPVELLPQTCPACGNVFQVATTLLGCRVACPTCQALLIATAATPVEPPPLPSSPLPAIVLDQPAEA